MHLTGVKKFKPILYLRERGAQFSLFTTFQRGSIRDNKPFVTLADCRPLRILI
jgi:hypothetical protein